MKDQSPEPSAGKENNDGLKNWVMVALTLLFVGFYAAALMGCLKPLTDDKMVMRLEPIIFVIIGYYFGRLPSRETEKTLRKEVDRKTEKAGQTDAMREKIKNAGAALSSSAPDGSPENIVRSFATADGGKELSHQTLRHSIATALRILHS